MRKELCIDEKVTVKEALKQLDKSAEKVLLVIDEEGRLLGTLTDGDIRRYILKGNSLDAGIQDAYHRNPRVVMQTACSLAEVKEIMLRDKVDLLPVVDEEGRVIDFITWSRAFREEGGQKAPVKKLEVPVVIMAGGKGTRMDPFTRILPKPLIPVGDKPIVEIIIEEFRKQGAETFYLTLHYKSEMIEAYFNGMEKEYAVEFFRENEYLGTAGSLRLLHDRLGGLCIVSNCDVIVKADFHEVIRLHRESHAAMTVLSSIQHHRIPYGVIEFKDKGEITDICEKPEYTFAINSGVYLLGPEALDRIPATGVYDMTELIKALIDDHKKVITYPVNASDYLDIGQWDEYRKTIDTLDLFR